jgi:fatty acid amide hydrolase
MLPDTVNNIYGRCLNPLNKQRSPGGSSGGEAALLAAKCSPLGFGGDIGGSIRTPSNFCGIYGFKQGSKRAINKGFNLCFRKTNASGQSEIKGVNGPMGKCVEDLALF